LQFERYIADLIQKQRSLVRQFESSNPLAMAPVNDPFSVAKQLAFEKAQRMAAQFTFTND